MHTVHLAFLLHHCTSHGVSLQPTAPTQHLGKHRQPEPSAASSTSPVPHDVPVPPQVQHTLGMAPHAHGGGSRPCSTAGSPWGPLRGMHPCVLPTLSHVPVAAMPEPCITAAPVLGAQPSLSALFLAVPGLGTRSRGRGEWY